VNEKPSLETSKSAYIFQVVVSLSHRRCLPYENNHLNTNTVFFQTYNKAKGVKLVSPEGLFFAQRYNIILNIIFEFCSLAL
jgi:hypothetical protein